MSSEPWVPPPHGTPCWINVFATDVQRARRFYEDVFKWTFRDSEAASADMAHFKVPGPACPGGGITKISEADFVKTKGRGGNVLYLTVDDIEKSAQDIIRAGGLQLSKVMPESAGSTSVVQLFEDTEGNCLGIHMT